MDLKNGTELVGRYVVQNRVGSGGASTVYKVIQKGLDVERALKVLDPHAIGIQQKLFDDTFASEIKLLSNLSHRNLAKILDYAETTINSQIVKFFVMEYANGGDLSAKSQFKNVDEALTLFGEMLDALEYLHDRSVLHCDIKPQNILIHEDPISGTLESKLADLGVAKPLSLPNSLQRELWSTLHVDTYLFGTHKYAPPYAQEILNSGGMVKRDDLQPWLPHFDLYCFGETLAETISEYSTNVLNAAEFEKLLASPKSVFKDSLPVDQFRYLTDYIRLLLEPEPNKGFKTTREAKEAFERIDPRKSLPARVPEITSIGSKYVINHGNRSTRLSERAYRIISHPCFQRLQRLNQLNLIEVIYPEARQPRLSHCLETFELAREVVGHLLGDETFRLHVGSREIGLFLCASLLHDIGHYPLAHTIEDLRNEIFEEASKPRLDFEMAQEFLGRKMDGWQYSIADILRDEWQIDVNELLPIIGRASVPTTVASMLFKQLLDGAVDIDKLAYLARDSSFTGVAYGKGIDIQALISSLVVLSPSAHKSIDHPQIGITHKGVNPAESMIIARYHMFSRVYWHHTNRAVMAMVRYVLRQVLNSSISNFSFNQYIEETIAMSDIEAVRLIASKYDEQITKQEQPYYNPLLGLLDNTRTIYKRLASFSKHPENETISECHKFLNGQNGLSSIEGIRVECIKSLTEMIKEPIPDSYLLFDVPLIDKSQGQIPNMFVLDPHVGSGIVRLNSISSLVKVISDEFDAQVKKSRIFVHPILRAKLRHMNLESEAAKCVENIVYDAAMRS